jgi:hypothetical protein
MLGAGRDLRFKVESKKGEKKEITGMNVAGRASELSMPWGRLGAS